MGYKMTRIGVIGAGKWGKNHLRIFSQLENCKLIGLADVNPEKEELAKQHNTQFFNDYKWY